MAKLHNTATGIGTFDGVGIDDMTELFVELTALKLIKSADKDIWVKDELTYTIEVTNMDKDEPLDPALPITGVVVTDNIDPEIATLVPGSVQLDGVAMPDTEYSYNPITGDLVMTVGTVTVTEPHTLTFQVEKVQQP